MTSTEDLLRRERRPESVVTDDARPLRLGLAGFGRVVREYYLPAFRFLGGIDIRGVADPLAASRDAARKLLCGVKTYVSAGELLESQMLDALLVASPPSTHLPIWLEAYRRRLPVFMEKPFLVPGQFARLEDTPAAQHLFMIN